MSDDTNLPGDDAADLPEVPAGDPDAPVSDAAAATAGTPGDGETPKVPNTPEARAAVERLLGTTFLDEADHGVGQNHGKDDASIDPVVRGACLPPGEVSIHADCKND